MTRKETEDVTRKVCYSNNSFKRLAEKVDIVLLVTKNVSESNPSQ